MARALSAAHPIKKPVIEQINLFGTNKIAPHEFQKVGRRIRHELVMLVLAPEQSRTEKNDKRSVDFER